jgi:hypothetical protein
MSAKEKFSTALFSLVGKGSIKERLINAVTYNLFVPALEDEFPEHLKADFVSLKSELTEKKAVGDEGSIVATVNSLTQEEAIQYAQKIVDLCFKLRDF